MNNKVLKAAALLLPLTAVAQDGLSKPKKSAKTPNFIVIMCDDLGYEDVSFNISQRPEGEINTPNIDRIANEGVKFTAGYTTYSVSSPSRAGFMTGRYGQRFGYERNPVYRPDELLAGLPLDQMTIAESMREVGYVNGIIGKWHLGAHVKNHPLNRGFDEFFGHLGGGHRYFPEELTAGNSYDVASEEESYRTDIMHNHDHVKVEKYLTEEFSDYAVDFVTRHKEDPFFLYLAYNAPHGPLQAPKKYLDRYMHIEDVKARTYAAMVSAVDDGVGLLLERLDELGIDENTIIFFLSDNGGPEKPKSAANNGILREGKSSIYDGGFRVPFAMRWSGHISPLVYDKPISSLDIFATLSGITSSPTKNELDGVNLIPYVTGKNDGYPHSTIYLRKFDQNSYAVRHYDFKYLRFPVDKQDIHGEQRIELYNIVKNPSEKGGNGGNLAKKGSKRIGELEIILDEWEKDLIDPVFEGIKSHGGPKAKSHGKKNGYGKKK